ncbi:hypothetical protein FQA39_LY15265 [Lamprigera yunnana]|nr:hypothetical protein FQA39_LY15265 [Lamprigera yunnana]
MKQIVKDVVNINKRVPFDKPARSEPSQQVSEFNLLKSSKYHVRVADLTNVLKGQKKHVEVREKINNFKKKFKSLPKPLEKPVVDRIQRKALFNRVKSQLDRFDAVVTSNRASNYLSFPLVKNYDVDIEKGFNGFRLKSDLQKRLEKLEPTPEVEIEKTYPLTMKEILERRKEMKKMKIIESSKAAKARRQNKIKSKKYHRVQRREKVKNQIKEFEMLQKTNPDEALKKLEEIERGRAEERATLRHRSTGKWARSKQVKAKYDSANRQELAQQLALSRELTQKVEVNDEESDVEEETVSVNMINTNKNNPWVPPIKTSEEIESFVTSYRKFWENRKSNVEHQPNDIETECSDRNIETSKKSETNNIKCGKIQCSATSKWEVSVLSDTEDEETDPVVDEIVKLKHHKDEVVNKCMRDTNSIKKNKTKKKNNFEQLIFAKKGKRPVLDEPIDEQNEPSYTNEVRDTNSRKKNKTKKKSNFEQLSFAKEGKRPILDEPLDEQNKPSGTNEVSKSALEKILGYNMDAIRNVKPITSIDPNDIINTKVTDLDSEIPNLIVADDEVEEDQKNIIAEAFEDDDVIENFQKEKTGEIEKAKPKDIDLFMPGWGSWGGPGIDLSRKKHANKRFIIKFPKESKRRDENKGNLVINEKGDDKIKPHLVSEVPFPFKTVKDYEASIRAPISNTFIPETSYRKMIRPAVKTKRGTIIEPMSEEILLKNKH